MKKLVCDKCGKEVTDRYDIEEILAGAAAWQASRKARGEEPIGLFPCEDYRNCGGVMCDSKTKRKGLFGLGGSSD
ncbi:MAG: hypothetical protein V3S02_01295 [Dehalococcoidales bacterium]